MAKRQITDFISEDLKTVAADSFADNIRMLDVSEIMPSLENFYEMSDLELLADDNALETILHNTRLDNAPRSRKKVVFVVILELAQNRHNEIRQGYLTN